MLDLGYVREHLDVIEKMARDRGVTLDLAAFRELDAERRRRFTSMSTENSPQQSEPRNRTAEEVADRNRRRMILARRPEPNR